jgi:hypothetical protein
MGMGCSQFSEITHFHPSKCLCPNKLNYNIVILDLERSHFQSVENIFLS